MASDVTLSTKTMSLSMDKTNGTKSIKIIDKQFVNLKKLIKVDY